MCASGFSRRKGITCWRSKTISPDYYGTFRTNSPPPTRPFPPSAQRERHAERQQVRTVNKGHGRLEVRTLTSTTALNGYLRWPGARQVLRVESETICRGHRRREVRYYVTSLSRDKADAAQLLGIIRGHWGAIENGLHWVRDAVFREDRSTISTGNAPPNLAALRNAAIACLRAFGAGSIASTLRSFQRKPQRLFAMLGVL